MNGKPFRLVAAETVASVVNRQVSLDSILPPLRRQVADKAPKFVEIVSGTLRWYYLLNALLDSLLNKPLRRSDQILHFILLTALYQIRWMRTPDHAVVFETVQLAKIVKREWACGMLNGVLRKFIRQQDSLVEQVFEPASQAALPVWWYRQLQLNWPDQLPIIVSAGNQKPPLILRLNRLQQTRSEYLAKLKHCNITATILDQIPSAIKINQPLDVRELPGFYNGMVSVQDLSAQQVAGMMQLKAGMRVLDGCAAPGGKTGHLLEFEPDLDVVVAVDLPFRVDTITQNLNRLGIVACVIAADTTQPDRWWDGNLFDRILLDVPCSGSGIIRRHPDIKLTRRESDLAQYAKHQLKLLQAVWPMLTFHGKLVYVTCSVFKQENDDVVQQFIDSQQNVQVDLINEQIGLQTNHGRQMLPGMTQGDGFYYSRLQKT